MRTATLILAATVLSTVGCTHAQLRRSTVGQASIVADIYQQQVLDNLAKFARDPNALPHFAVPGEGFTTVTDGANAGGGLEWNATSLSKALISGGGDRQIQENYKLVPVSNPRKLELMRCAFQRAVASCRSAESTGCPACEERFKHFYNGTTDKAVSEKTKDGIVTSDCLNACWFKVGCEDCVTKVQRKNPCCMVGVHCGTAVWVCPGVGTDELAKLTIAILDYATNDPPVIAKKTREVIAYLDRDLGATKAAEAAYVVRGKIAIDRPVSDLTDDLLTGASEERVITRNGFKETVTTIAPKEIYEEVAPARRSIEMLPFPNLQQQVEKFR